MKKVLVMEGVERETLSVGKNLMVVRITFKKGAEVPFHTHEHEQSSYIQSGCLKLLIDEEEIVLTEGMSAIVPPNAKHKAIALKDTVDINSFTPVREDYLGVV
ncbi:MAG: cupin domain-containing protein [Clostridium sp.]|nr:cupin domain-containing protein [Clostridium sp.]